MTRCRLPLPVGAVVRLVGGLALLIIAVAITVLDASAEPMPPVSTDPVHLGAVPGHQTPTQAADADSDRQARLADRAAGSATSVTVAPERIEVPDLGVDSPVVPVDVDSNHRLGLPQDPDVIGWWAGGPRPGEDQGTAILAGHVNTAAAGPGALARLTQVRPGARIVVSGSERTVGFRVVAVRQYSKTTLPAGEVFSQQATGRLAIVTCGGPFNPETGSYRDNVIVYAVAE